LCELTIVSNWDAVVLEVQGNAEIGARGVVELLAWKWCNALAHMYSLDGGGDWFISTSVTVASDEKQMNFNKSFLFIVFCVARADCSDFQCCDITASCSCFVQSNT